MTIRSTTLIHISTAKNPERFWYLRRDMITDLENVPQAYSNVAQLQRILQSGMQDARKLKKSNHKFVSQTKTMIIF